MEATTNLLDSVRLGYTIQVDLPSGPLRFWSGEHALTLEQVEFIGGAGIFSIEANEGTNPKLSMLLGTEAFTEAFRKFTGPAKIVIQGIGSLDSGTSWTALDFVLRGRLSSPRIREKEYEVDIVPVRHYPTVRTWSNEDHQKLYPGDTIFAQQRSLSDGKVEDYFGDVPLYDHEYYTNLASSGSTGGGGGSEDDGEVEEIIGTRGLRAPTNLKTLRTLSTIREVPLEPPIKGGL